MKNSEFLSLNTSDFVKGLVVFVFTSVLTLLYQMANAGSFDFKAIAMVALTSALGYLVKQFSTNKSGNLFTFDSIIGGRPNDR